MRHLILVILRDNAVAPAKVSNLRRLSIARQCEQGGLRAATRDKRASKLAETDGHRASHLLGGHGGSGKERRLKEMLGHVALNGL